MAGRPRGSTPIALASGLLLCLVACSATPSRARPAEPVDLVGQDWTYMPGVTVGPTGLAVSATGFRIVEQDGSGGQANPPVNLLGTHLTVDGGFSIGVTLTDVAGDASVALYDRPPVIADEFRIEPPGICLTLRGADLEVAVWNGSRGGDPARPRPVHDEHVRLADPAAPLTISRSGGALDVTSGGETVASTGEGAIFGSGRLWLGLSSEGGSFAVHSFTARGRDGGMVEAVDTAGHRERPSDGGLQALANRVRPGFRVGAAVALGPMVADAAYAKTVLSDFGSVTPENAMKPQFLSPQQGVYTFQEADALIAVARRNGLSVHGHTLAFGEALPRWMQDLPTGTEAERSASAAALLDYVRTVVSHFAGRLDSWDVVNEPLDPDQGPGMQHNLWFRVLGPDYPAIVSRAVYAADPGVEQFINENGAEGPGERQDALRELALRTNADGGHIAGVGLQAHVYDFDTDAIDPAALTATLDRFGAAGLRVRISENDVSGDHGTSRQADQYAAVFAACLQNPACVSYTTWGVDDRYDWFVGDDGDLRQGHDLLFDEGRPTPAYTALQRAMGG